jgi:hypothetical protein
MIGGHGLPIRSGIIESACKDVQKQQESGSGMRRTEPNATDLQVRMLDLRIVPKGGIQIQYLISRMRFELHPG